MCLPDVRQSTSNAQLLCSWKTSDTLCHSQGEKEGGNSIVLTAITQLHLLLSYREHSFP